MADRYIFHPQNYDPTEDRIPPPRQSTPGCFKWGCLSIFALIIGAGAFFAVKNNERQGQIRATQTAVAAIPTATHTLDAWDSTGTAIFWLTYTPTSTPTASPTLEATFTPTSTGTVTPDIPATMTAIYNTLMPPLTIGSLTPSTLEAGSGGSPEPKAQPTSRPQVVVVTRETLIEVTSKPQVVIVTRESPPVAVTRQIVVPVIVTATPTSTLTPTFTATYTDVPTLTPTFTDIPSLTPTETPTPTPTYTNVPTLTLEPTLTPTFTSTFTETPTEAIP